MEVKIAPESAESSINRPSCSFSNCLVGFAKFGPWNRVFCFKIRKNWSNAPCIFIPLHLGSKPYSKFYSRGQTANRVSILDGRTNGDSHRFFPPPKLTKFAGRIRFRASPLPTPTPVTTEELAYIPQTRKLSYLFIVTMRLRVFFQKTDSLLA